MRLAGASWKLIGALALLAAVTWTPTALAQSPFQPTPNSAGSAPAPTAASSPPAATVLDRYPPCPTGFFRGNNPQNPLEAGYYFSTFKLVTYLLLLAFWVWAVDWLDRDSHGLRIRPAFWNAVFVTCGFCGLLLGLCAPGFLPGLGLILFAVGLPLGLYLVERNQKVPESARILTPQHLQKVADHWLGKFGLGLGTSGGSTKARSGPDIVFLGKSDVGRHEATARVRQVENSRGFLAAKELVYDAILRRATDIHLEPRPDEIAVRLRIDGVMYPTEPFDRRLGEAVINIFKVLGGMDITEKRKPQDGSFSAIVDGRDVDFRVASQGTRLGQKLSIRILDQSAAVCSLDELGLRKTMRDRLLELIRMPHGMLLVAGPTGAGKSTTLYACIRALDAYQTNIITIEDPIEYKIDNVTQIEINTRAGQNFASSLRSVLRQDPDVVMVGEIRDSETANIACQAANTGHLVLSTVHANDSVTALFRMLDLGVEPYALATALNAVLAQRLVRRLCPDCKEAYRPNPDFLRRAGLPADRITHFYRCPTNRDHVCPTCGGLGYRGRIGVFELLTISDRIRELIREKASLSVIRAEARKNGMLYMREEGLRLVVQGITSVDELLRVVR